MIIIKSPREIDLMRQAGKITAGARTIARQMVEPGVTTQQIDREVHKFITKSGAAPSFLNYGGFPASACISVNDEIIHGIPGPRVIHEGDIVSLDVGAKYKGFNGDCAGTFPCGTCSEEAMRLIEVTRQSFFEGIKFAKEGYRISDIGHAIQEYVERFGYSVVRESVAVEPMVNIGGVEVRVLDNDWTVVTADGSLSAHYENTILITDGEPEILTIADDI